MPADFGTLYDLRESDGDAIRRATWRSGGREATSRGGVDARSRQLDLVTPDGSALTNLTVRYIRSWSGLHYGTVGQASSGATQVYLSAAAVGVRTRGDDRYVGYRVELTDSDEVAWVTDHDETSGLLTVSPAFSAAPGVSAEYSILPPWPEEWDEALMAGALRRRRGDADRALGESRWAELAGQFVSWAIAGAGGLRDVGRTMDRHVEEGTEIFGSGHPEMM